MDWLQFLRHENLLVVIGDFDLAGIAVIPFKSDSPLVVDSDAVLFFTISVQTFQPVPRDYGQCRKVRSRVQHDQSPQSSSFDSSKLPASMQLKQPFGFGRPEGLDHKTILYCLTLAVHR